MSGSHEKLPMIFWVQIVLVLLVGMKYLIAETPEHHGGEKAEHKVDTAIKTALKPVGEVAVKAEAGATAAGSGRSGVDIVKKTCSACHVAGVANAPKLEASAKDAWAKRLDAAKGIDGLVASARKGKGAMPPSGTDPSLTADELKAAITHMLGKAGVEVAAADKAPAPATKTTETDAAKPADSKAADLKAAPAPATEVTDTKVAAAPANTAAPAAKAVPATTTAEVAAPAPATTTTEAAVAKEPVSPPAEPAVPATPAKAEAVQAPAAPAAPEAAVAPTAPKAEAVMAAAAPAPATTEAAPAPTSQPAAEAVPAKPEAGKPVEPAIAPVAPTPEASKPADSAAAKEEVKPDLAAGEKTYKAICFSCHDMNVANAPKPGDKAAWTPRIAKGMDALYNTAVKGDPKMPAMPAKGGNPNLSDAEVINAVYYMVESSK